MPSLDQPGLPLLRERQAVFRGLVLLLSCMNTMKEDLAEMDTAFILQLS